MNKIRKGDAVIVTAGSEKGRTGTVVGVRPDGRVLVEGVNMVKKHQRPNPARGVQGGMPHQASRPMSVACRAGSCRRRRRCRRRTSRS